MVPLLGTFLATRIVRSHAIDIDLGNELDALAVKRGISKSELVNQLLRSGLQAQRVEAARALVNAGLGTAAMTALLVLGFLLA